MLPPLLNIAPWRLLTPKNITTRRLWGWGYSLQKILSLIEPQPIPGNDFIIASDYGGEHPAATHLIYCYLVVGGGIDDWLRSIATIRADGLPNGRRMAYKRLSDPARQDALGPFLEAAANLDAHLVAIAVDKQKKWLSLIPEEIDRFRNANRLTANWSPRSLEGMIRKVQFPAILASIWSQQHMNIRWITDQDEFVVNDRRHDDALASWARFLGYYLDHPLGIVALNTTAQDTSSRVFEDLCAIPDLAAGMLSDVSARLPRGGSWEAQQEKELLDNLPMKAEILTDWFWDETTRIRKTLISIDVEGDKFAVRRVWKKSEAATTAL